MDERLIADAENAGLAVDDLEPEFGTPEKLIREVLGPMKERRGYKSVPEILVNL